MTKGRTVRKQYTKEFKVEAVRLMELAEKSPSELALELGVKRSLLYKWQKALRSKGTEGAFRGAGAVPLGERRLRRGVL